MSSDAGHIWDEPVRGRSGEFGLLRLSGLEQLLAGIHGRGPAPPNHHLTGLRPTEAGVGRATFVMPATEWLQNPAGIFPGGILAFLADAPFGGAISTGLPVGKVLTTAELSMSFLRPATPSSGTLIGRGLALHTGRSVGLSQVHVEDAEGRLLAHGTSRLVLIDVPVDETAPVPKADPPVTDPPDPYLRPARGTVYGPQEIDGAHGLELLRGFSMAHLTRRRWATSSTPHPSMPLRGAARGACRPRPGWPAPRRSCTAARSRCSPTWRWGPASRRRARR